MSASPPEEDSGRVSATEAEAETDAEVEAEGADTFAEAAAATARMFSARIADRADADFTASRGFAVPARRGSRAAFVSIAVVVVIVVVVAVTVTAVSVVVFVVVAVLFVARSSPRRSSPRSSARDPLASSTRLGPFRSSSMSRRYSRNAVEVLEVSSFLRNVAFQWFLTAFSVRPGMAFAISAQRLPRRRCAATRVRSSSSDHAPRLMSGRTWLCHRSRHCLPERPTRICEIMLHLPRPYLRTRLAGRGREARDGRENVGQGRAWVEERLGRGPAYRSAAQIRAGSSDADPKNKNAAGEKKIDVRRRETNGRAFGGDVRRAAPREVRVLIPGPSSANLEGFRLRGDGTGGQEIEIIGEEVRGVVARGLRRGVRQRRSEAAERPAGDEGNFLEKSIGGWRSGGKTNRRMRRGARARGNGASRSRTHQGSSAWSSTHSKSTKSKSSKENSSDPDVCASRGWGFGVARQW